MKAHPFVSADKARSDFPAAMYHAEVPSYGTRVNDDLLAADPLLEERLKATDSLDRISEELSTVRRGFAVMGMAPVGAAGTFQSNPGDDATREFVVMLDRDPGSAVVDEFAHYAGIQRASLEMCLGIVNMAVAAE